MTNRLALRTMRARLAAAIALVTVGALGGSFFALHQRTGSDLQGRIDSNLREQYGEFRQELPRRHLGREAARASGAIVHRLSAVSPGVADLPDRGHGRAQRDQRATRGRARGPRASAKVNAEGGEQRTSLLDAPDGLHNVSTTEASRLRVYSQPIFARRPAARDLPRRRPARADRARAVGAAKHVPARGRRRSCCVAGRGGLARDAVHEADPPSHERRVRCGRGRFHPPHRRRAKQRRDAAARRVVRSHARPARGRLPAPAGVRVRRLARAAHTADGAPRARPSC